MLWSLILIALFTFGIFVVEIYNATNHPAFINDQTTTRTPIEDAILCFSIDADVSAYYKENNSETTFRVSYEEILNSQGEEIESDTWFLCFYKIDYFTYWYNSSIFTVNFNCLYDPMNTIIITFYSVVENETPLDDDDIEFMFIESFSSEDDFSFSYTGYGLALLFLVEI